MYTTFLWVDQTFILKIFFFYFFNYDSWSNKHVYIFWFTIALAYNTYMLWNTDVYFINRNNCYYYFLYLTFLITKLKYVNNLSWVVRLIKITFAKVIFNKPQLLRTEKILNSILNVTLNLIVHYYSNKNIFFYEHNYF